jgi:hypothetical protein
MPKKKVGKVPKVGKAKTPKVEKAPKLQYSIEVEVNDIHYKGSAITLYQCLIDFVNNPSFPFAIKSRCLIKYSDGKKERQVVWPPIRAHRQFKMLSLKPSQAEFQADKWLSDLAN